MTIVDDLCVRCKEEESEFDSPAPLCDPCWISWFSGYYEIERVANGWEFIKNDKGYYEE